MNQRQRRLGVRSERLIGQLHRKFLGLRAGRFRCPPPGAPGRPTILVYAHYDVQAPEPPAPWRPPPFEATATGGRLHGRGASDDKGPMLIALAAIEAFLAVEGRLPVTLKILIEGEEETGGPTKPALLARHGDLLAGDAILSADGG